MYTSELTPAVLADLRRRRDYPAVSVVMPTHRRQPGNAQDPVRLRNLITSAKEQVAADPAVSRANRLSVMAGLDRAAEDLEETRLLDGLVILVSPGEHQVWSIPRWVPERVVLSTTYLTRNLVSAREASAPYWTVPVSAERTTLWSGDTEGLAESLGHGFPVAAPARQPDTERRMRVGDTPSTFRDEQTLRYLREVDARLMALLDTEPRVLFLLGDPEALAALNAVGAASARAADRVAKVAPVDGPASALFEELQPAARSHEQQRVAMLRKSLDSALGRKALAAGIDEVYQMVHEGRVAQMVVEEHYWEPVRVEHNHLVPTESSGDQVREDVVDEIVEQALDTSAEVSFVPDDELAGHGRIAAIVRY